MVQRIELHFACDVCGCEATSSTTTEELPSSAPLPLDWSNHNERDFCASCREALFQWLDLTGRDGEAAVQFWLEFARHEG